MSDLDKLNNSDSYCIYMLIAERILYYSPEQLTICIFPVFCCLFVLFVLFHNVCKKHFVTYNLQIWRK